MRVVAGILYIVVMAICGLGIQGGTLQDYPSVYFQDSTLQQDFPTIFFNILAGETYGDFIADLREIVTRTADTKNGSIPVLLNPAHPVPVRERFVKVHLTGRNGKTVILALDVTNLYVAAFSANNVAYFFRDFSALERENLFSGMLTIRLSFTSNYVSLEHKAGVGRENISLGPTPLDEACTKSLWSGTTVTEASIAKALLVVIQMVSEAARFRHIEERVRRSFTAADHDQLTFRPDGLMLSMENEWPSMSLEVQRSIEGGIFIGVVQLQDESFQPLRVDNFNTLSRYTMVALLLFRCGHPRATAGTSSTTPAAAQIIRMPVDVLAGEEYYDEETCTVGEPTRRISGLDGLCMDVRNESNNDGIPIQLWPCGAQRNQQWTFHTDGTIQSMGKCMTSNGYHPGDYVMIFNCSTAPVPDATKWVVSIDGSITNPHSGLVLTAPQAAQTTILLVVRNTHSAKQGRSVGDDVEPIVTYIVGFKYMCLQGNNENNTRVWLEDCAVDRPQQWWALYSDGTIRVDSDRSLCVTSDGHSSRDAIIILTCDGGINQRLVFNTDGTILNPNAQLVMDVRQSNVALRQIILYQPTGNPNQQWMTMITRTRPSLTS
uniref:Ribosome-inactivating protein PMRIPt n=1 Tax=Polygonatum multiflorum TaxID=45371 RepID=RIPT_POLML|nr:RecName: Full=Ribosome-inactivating protein PMRIPt; Contains: RecName: Full=PMRIPt A chain; AltName: Full=rRNA N-glycosidase; Contains: RecName: Full=Linker peptide; Contains: RecName: Full=PMRIPt B chain; Flags: Precursor [Polygonatum multiflorum]AAF37219.1 ribosome inactivating protein RIPt [Polygonatum multiflorum]